jgi:hypothetical protein
MLFLERSLCHSRNEVTGILECVVSWRRYRTIRRGRLRSPSSLRSFGDDMGSLRDFGDDTSMSFPERSDGNLRVHRFLETVPIHYGI